MSHPNDELEALLLRIVPNLGSEWVGASQPDIEALERKAGRPLPPFYLWFLNRMGESMGAAAHARTDFSARGVLAADPLPNMDPRYFVISCSTDETEVYDAYDLEQPIRDDATVVRLEADGTLYHPTYDTFREMLALACLDKFRVATSPQRCEGWLEVDDKEVQVKLAPAMAAMGFTTPIRTGPRCGLFERNDVTLVSKIRDTSRPLGVEYFSMGGPSSAELRRALGTIATQSSVRVKVKDWNPPLPGGQP